MVARVNEWGRRVDASLELISNTLSALRSEVEGTQAVLVVTVQEAKTALGAMHEGFRMALDAHGAHQRSAVEAIVTGASAKFSELERRLAEEKAQIEQWALGEGARTASQISGAVSLLGITPPGTPPQSPRVRPATSPATATPAVADW